MDARVLRTPTKTSHPFSFGSVKTAQPDDTKVKILTLTKPRGEKSTKSCEDAKPGCFIVRGSVPDRLQLPEGSALNDRPAFCT